MNINDGIKILHGHELYRRAESYWHKKDYAQAEQLFKQVLIIYTKYCDLRHPFVANVLKKLADIYIYQNKLALTIELYESYREDLCCLPNCVQQMEVLASLAYYYQMQGRYLDAHYCLNQALEIGEQLHLLSTDMISLLSHYAINLYLNNEVKLAQDVYEKVVSSYESADSKGFSFIKDLHMLATICRVNNDSEKAENTHNKILAWCQQEPIKNRFFIKVVSSELTELDPNN